MARGTDAGIHYYWYSSLLNDDLQEVFHAQTLVGADRCGEWHHGSCSSLFQVLAEGRVCLAIWQYHETEFHELLSCLEGLDGVWQEVAWVWVNLQFEPVGAESLTSHLCGENSLLGITYSTGVREQLDVWVLYDVGEEVVLLVFQFDALHGDGYHLCLRGLDGLCHEIVVVELSCSEEKA